MDGSLYHQKGDWFVWKRDVLTAVCGASNESSRQVVKVRLGFYLLNNITLLLYNKH